MTARDTFLAVCNSGPLLKSDAIVVLSGDGTVRLEVALQLLVQNAAPMVVVTGSLDNPPHSLTAAMQESWLLGKGVNPSRIQKVAGLNTREEAVAVVKLAKKQKWGRLLVCTSPYHSYRAFLTFTQCLHETKTQAKTQVLMVPASQTKWTEKPEGSDKTRLELLDEEMTKVETYQKLGHVASYEAGLGYLLRWDGK